MSGRFFKKFSFKCSSSTFLCELFQELADVSSNCRPTIFESLLARNGFCISTTSTSIRLWSPGVLDLRCCSTTRRCSAQRAVLMALCSFCLIDCRTRYGTISRDVRFPANRLLLKKTECVQRLFRSLCRRLCSVAQRETERWFR